MRVASVEMFYTNISNLIFMNWMFFLQHVIYNMLVAFDSVNILDM
jgi:hypothetical protein